jgi:hypothetical protein
MDNTGQQLDQQIAALKRELEFTRNGSAMVLAKIDAMRARLALPTLCPLEIGDTVEKVGGDYTFKGTVRAVLAKVSGAVRVVVENPDGVLFIFNPDNLRKVDLSDRADRPVLSP